MPKVACLLGLKELARNVCGQNRLARSTSGMKSWDIHTATINLALLEQCPFLLLFDMLNLEICAQIRIHLDADSRP
jgi:hypothetical protein